MKKCKQCTSAWSCGGKGEKATQQGRRRWHRSSNLKRGLPNRKHVQSRLEVPQALAKDDVWVAGCRVGQNPAIVAHRARTTQNERQHQHDVKAPPPRAQPRDNTRASTHSSASRDTLPVMLCRCVSTASRHAMYSLLARHTPPQPNELTQRPAAARSPQPPTCKLMHMHTLTFA
jgi:hypothetical protein